jgi:hypothetical protein
VTEVEWLEDEHPPEMLALLGRRYDFRQDGVYRRGALFACACCRRIWPSFSDPRSRELVDVIECAVDGSVEPDAVWEAEEAARAAAGEDWGFAAHATWLLARLAEVATSTQVEAVVGAVADARAFAVVGTYDPGSPSWIAEVETERLKQAEFLRDIFGNPFHPVSFSPEWRTDTAVSLAKQMYESRDFSAMPILADALQDAGCDSADSMDHCRGPGPHVRGCWVVDLVLGKQ